LVAKIERQIAVENCDEILQEADAVMVARGDLGVQIPLEEVPRVQKQLIRRANLLGKPVITATQMLESMVDNVRPTRAEASDVANAIIDGTDAIMLSAETATGKYPVEAVRTMVKIATATEQQDRTYNPGLAVRQHWMEEFASDGGGIKDNIVVQVPNLVEHLNLRYVVAPTDSGDTARRVSRFKPTCWTLAFTENMETYNRLAFSFGVYPFLGKMVQGNWDQTIIKHLKRIGIATKEDRIVIIAGAPLEKHTGTNSLKVVTLS
jgi:pyruvate kinase